MKLFRVLKSIVHGKYPKFISGFWSELWELLGISILASSSHHSQMVGQIEHAHCTLEQLFRVYSLESENDCDWFKVVLFVELAINNFTADFTGLQLFELVYCSIPAASLYLLPNFHTVPTTQIFLENFSSNFLQQIHELLKYMVKSSTHMRATINMQIFRLVINFFFWLPISK